MLLRVLFAAATDADGAGSPAIVRLSLNERDRPILLDLQTFLDADQSATRGPIGLQVRVAGDRRAHWARHSAFRGFPLRGSKARSYAGFVRVCRMIQQGDHLERGGLRAIVGIACEINLGKRRYSCDQLLRVLDEVKG
jgi:hypothetical protein